MNYATLLELLSANGFDFDAPQRDPRHINSMLSVLSQIVYIGDEILSVYEYDSIVAMERDSGFIHPSGMGIGNPDDSSLPNISITWEYPPYWLKRDMIIVLYTGENIRIIDFLHETLDLFAGHGYQQ
jgi:hypothetical protein